MTTKAEQRYQQMSREQRRVAIAKDVIAAIRAKKFGRVSPGTYIYGPGDLPLNKSTAGRLMPECEVCARGAMMLTKIAKYNGYEVSANKMVCFLGPMAKRATSAALRDAFSPLALNLIETAFERSTSFASGCSPTAAVEAYEFGCDHDDPSDRLLAIMQNIVDHHGTFRPEVRYIVTEK